MPDSSPITNNFKFKKKTHFSFVQILVNEKLLLHSSCEALSGPLSPGLLSKVSLTLPLSSCFRTYRIIVAWR